MSMSQIERASKPAGLLYQWCAALLLCDGSIKGHRAVAAKLEAFTEAQAPALARLEAVKAKLADDEATVAFILDITRGID